MAYVYKHIRLDKNTTFYIGIGSDSKGQYSRASNTYHRNKHWHNIVNKYGYKVEITHDCIVWEEACAIEKYLILFYGRKDLKTGDLINLTEGGEGVLGVVLTAEIRKKLSDSKRGEKHPMYGKKLKPETKIKIGNFHRGKTISLEQRKGLSDRMKGQVAYNKGVSMPIRQYNQMIKNSENWKQKVANYSLDGCLIGDYGSVIEAARDNNIQQGNITNACNNKVMYGGCLWRYFADTPNSVIEPHELRVKPIIQYTMTGEFVAEYTSAMQAARENGWVKSTILRAYKRKNNTAYNFKWAVKQSTINEKEDIQIQQSIP